MEAHIHLCFMSSILILSLGYIQGKVNCLNLLYWGYPINFMYYIISGKSNNISFGDSINV